MFKRAPDKAVGRAAWREVQHDERAALKAWREICPAEKATVTLRADAPRSEPTG